MIHHPMTAGRTCCSMHVLLAPLCTYNTTYHSVITMAPWGNNWTKAGCIWECLHLLQWPWPIPWGSAALARGLGQGEHWARACGFTGYWSKEIFEWKPCDLCGGCHVRQAYQWNLLPVGTAEGDTAGLIWLEAFWTLGVAGVGGSTWSSGPGKAMWLGSATTSSLCLSNSITTMLQL